MGWNSTELTQNRVTNLASFDQARAEIDNATNLFNQNVNFLSQTKDIAMLFLEGARLLFGERSDVFGAFQEVMKIIAKCEAPISAVREILTNNNSEFQRLRSQYDLSRIHRENCSSGKSLSKSAKDLAAFSRYCESLSTQEMAAGLAAAVVATTAIFDALCLSSNADGSSRTIARR